MGNMMNSRTSCSHHPVKSLGLNVIAEEILGDEGLNLQKLKLDLRLSLPTNVV
jgi:hypothetical protein